MVAVPGRGKKLKLLAGYSFHHERFLGEEQACPLDRLEGEVWTILEPIGIPVLRIHPSYLIQAAAWDIFALWRAYEAGHLPEPGGVNDQPAYLLACFQILDGATAKLTQAERDKRKR